MATTPDLRARLVEIQLERELESRIEDTARTLYGPLDRHSRFSVVTCARVGVGIGPITISSVYQSKCVGYPRDGDAWELLSQSRFTYKTVCEALEALLDAMRYDVQEATKNVRVGMSFKGAPLRR